MLLEYCDIHTREGFLFKRFKSTNSKNLINQTILPFRTLFIKSEIKKVRVQVKLGEIIAIHVICKEPFQNKLNVPINH